MREIGFRAWNHSIRELKEVLSINFTGKYCVVDRAEKIDLWYYKNEEIKLMQFTSTFDDDGTGIYEGDIIFSENEDGFCLFLVKFGENEKLPETVFTSFYLKHLKCFEFLYEEEASSENDETTTEFVNKYNPDHKSFVIIGNKYENPELLGDDNKWQI